jgi:YihY family inner membrane protein
MGLLSGTVGRCDAWQRRHAVGGLPIAVLKKFGEDRASNLATLIAYYAFFSLFPLLLALVSILGFVLDGNPELRQDIVDSALARVPVVGDQLQGKVEPLSGSGVALAVGIAGALWAGLGVMVALSRAFAEIWDVPRLRQPNWIKSRLRGLAGLLTFGIILIAASVATGLAVGGGIGPLAERGATLLLSLVVNFAVVLTVFALLTPRPWRFVELLPGVALGALGILTLQSIGGWYVDLTVNNASATYGVFALVIGLLSWFYLLAHVLLFAVETNVVLRYRLWPRSLTGELAPADRLALTRSADATRQDKREEISVSFGDGDAKR